MEWNENITGSDCDLTGSDHDLAGSNLRSSKSLYKRGGGGGGRNLRGKCISCVGVYTAIMIFVGETEVF